MAERIFSYHIWFTRDDDDGIVAAAILASQEDGQTALVGSEEFGPFDRDEDVSAWLWHQLTLDRKTRLR